MYVCSCLSVTDSEVNAEIALGARTVEAVGERCGAGTGCGSCRDTIEELLVAAALRREVGCCGNGCGACSPVRVMASGRSRRPDAGVI